MDAFDDPFFCLDQFRAWDPDIIRLAASPDCPTIEIASHVWHAQKRAKAQGRDIEDELWAASGWRRTSPSSLVPLALRSLAEDLGIPPRALTVPFARPFDPALSALYQALADAGPIDRELLKALLNVRWRDEESILLDPKFKQLSDELREVVQQYVDRPKVHGPPRAVSPFPIDKFELSLLRSDKLTASGNLPGEAWSRDFTTKDWAGLEICVGGHAQRLCVWMIGNASNEGGGDIENVRISRASIMAMFPADSPKPTLDQVLMEAANQNGGTLSQTKAEEIAKDAGVFTTREDLRNALPRLRIEGTQGRRRKAR